MKYSELLTLLEEKYQQKLPFVIFKKPSESQICLYAQSDTAVHLFDEKSSESGFVFVPFYSGDKIWISSKESYTSDFQEKSIENKFSEIALPLSEENHQNYLKKINKSLKAIRTNKLQKVVLSRPVDVAINKVSLSEIWKNLLSRYPQAFCYLWYHPKVGCWTAATPETLLKFENHQLQTMALAGTQVYAEKVEWSEKEIEEQAIVRQNIEQQLQNRVSQLKIYPTETVQAGILAHLCTRIEATLDDENSIFEMVEKLHPTPAVCGYPTELAKEFILTYEGYEREYYSGYCGTVSYDKNNSTELELFVNLRCMQLSENQVRIYVGGGITADSDAEKEWEETQKKAQTMLQVIQKYIRK